MPPNPAVEAGLTRGAYVRQGPHRMARPRIAESPDGALPVVLSCWAICLVGDRREDCSENES